MKILFCLSDYTDCLGDGVQYTQVQAATVCCVKPPQAILLPTLIHVIMPGMDPGDTVVKDYTPPCCRTPKLYDQGEIHVVFLCGNAPRFYYLQVIRTTPFSNTGVDK